MYNKATSEKSFLDKKHLSEIKRVKKSWTGKKATVGMFCKDLEKARSLINLKSCMGNSEAGEAGCDRAKKFGFDSKSNFHFKKGEMT